LRNFAARVARVKFPDGESATVKTFVQTAESGFDGGLADDLNTAQALAAVFDLVRDVNTAIDRGEFRRGDAPLVLGALKKFDRVLAVLEDNDAERLRALGFGGAAAGIGDAEIEALVNQRQEARRSRDYRRADEIRQKLAENGIILEDSRDGGVRWKRK